MKIYLELEGNVGPKPRPQPQAQLQLTQLQPSTITPPQNNIPMTRKAPGLKTNDKKKRTALAKRRYKVRVIVQLIPTTPTPTVPENITPTVPTPSLATQMPMVKSAAMSFPVTVYNLAKGKFDEVPYSTGRPQIEGNLSIQNSNPPPLEDIPNVPIREGSHRPNAGSASENLFKARKDWPIPLHQHPH